MSLLFILYVFSTLCQDFNWKMQMYNTNATHYTECSLENVINMSNFLFFKQSTSVEWGSDSWRREDFPLSHHILNVQLYVSAPKSMVQYFHIKNVYRWDQSLGNESYIPKWFRIWWSGNRNNPQTGTMQLRNGRLQNPRLNSLDPYFQLHYHLLRIILWIWYITRLGTLWFV